MDQGRITLVVAIALLFLLLLLLILFALLAVHDTGSTGTNTQTVAENENANAIDETVQDKVAVATDSGDIETAESPEETEPAIVAEETGDNKVPSDRLADDQSTVPGDLLNQKVTDDEHTFASPVAPIGMFSRPEARLFGIGSEGRNIVYVIDISSSMGSPIYVTDARGTPSPTSRFETVCAELMRSVSALDESQRFSVIFFDDYVVVNSDFAQCSPKKNNIETLKKWIESLFPRGGTDPMPAMNLVFRDTQFADADVVFLLSDGEFSGSAPGLIKNLNSGGAVIHTISCETNAQTLKQIAADNGGKYFWIK